MTCPTQPRILFLDIETKLIEVRAFGIRDQYLDIKQIKDIPASARGVHCIGLKWAGERKVRVLSEWEHGYEAMIRGAWEALDEADAVCTYNGASFDLPILDGQFALLKLGPVRPPTQIDLLKTARKMRFPSSKLDYIAQAFELGHKVKHPGLEMWDKVLDGCEKAQRKMAKYCAGDIRLTEEVHDRLRPYIRNYPRLPGRQGDTCPNCGIGTLTSQGSKTRATTHFRVQQLMCNHCGSWREGRRTKIAA